jgi:hypothetical protein
MPPKRFASGCIPLPVPWTNADELKSAATAHQPFDPLFEGLRRRLGQGDLAVRHTQADFAALCLTVEYLEHVYWRNRVVATEASVTGMKRKQTAHLISSIAESDRQMADRLRRDWNEARHSSDLAIEPWRGRLSQFGFLEKDILVPHFLEAARFSGELAQDPERFAHLLSTASRSQRRCKIDGDPALPKAR